MAYAEFRRSYEGDAEDERIIFYGLDFYLDKYVRRQWTLAELEATARFIAGHSPGGTPFPWPSDLFRRIVEDCDGWFPVQVHALPAASVIYPHVPVWTLTAEGQWAGLVTFLETLLTISTWYPSTVATLSRRCRDLIEAAFAQSVDEADQFLLESRLHDFGFRGCASVEQAVHGGLAHLLSFRGTDTLPAAYAAQFAFNQGKPVASSIPASEHSVMLGYAGGDGPALDAIIAEFGDGPVSVVLDTWDYERALEEELPRIAPIVKARGGTLVLRPDSGDAVVMVMRGLEAADKAFGSRVNSKGYRVLDHCTIIFGDGIKQATITAVLVAMQEAGWSAQNVAFGMGSNLLHRVHRDTMSFATKVSYVRRVGGEESSLAKRPKADKSKWSLPGRFVVLRDESNVPIVYPAEDVDEDRARANMLRLVYDCGKPITSCKKESFDEMRDRLAQEWNHAPKKAIVISEQLALKMQSI